MTSVTPKRRRRLAYMAAGTAAAMVLLPATASAQQDNPFDEVVEQLRGTASQIQNGQAPNVTGPAAPAGPGVLQEDDDEGNVPDGEFVNPDLGTPTEDDDSEGHETDDPAFPDGGRGEVADVELGQDQETDIAEVTEYEAEITDDGRSQSRVTVLGLFGDEVVGSDDGSASDGETETRSNPTEGLCEGSGGALCLGLLYSETSSTETDDSLKAFAQGGVLALCLGGSNENADATYECEDAPLTLGAAEGAATAERDDNGDTTAASTNELANLCLGGTEDEDPAVCDGLGLQALHSESDSTSNADTNRNSYIVGIDAAGDRTEILGDPAGLALPPGCGGEDDESPALLCLFVNQGESFIFNGDDGAASAQEALHLDLLRNTPIGILAELGKAETVARDFECEPDNPDGPCPGDGDGDKPECSDKIDNDGDGKIDFPKDPECESPEDDSEANGKKGDDNGAAGADGDNGDGLAMTGASIAPMLAGAMALLGMGALTMAATRRRVGKHLA